VIWRRLCTPLGGLAALLVLWLPWAKLQCGSTVVKPTLWQLAEEEPALYAYSGLALLLLVFGLLGLLFRARGWSVAALVTAVGGIGAWVYLLFRRQELLAQQTQVEAFGGRLQEWLDQIEIEPASGFYLYLAAMILGALFAAWNTRSAGRRPVARE